jgi:glycosyltransferase involved in cell wall biosynthesis
MPRLLYLTPDLGPTGPGKLASQLVSALPRDRYPTVVGCLTPPSGPHEKSKVGGLTEVPFHLRHPLWHLVNLIGRGLRLQVVRGYTPDVIHAFGPAAVRAAWPILLPGIGPRGRPRLVASGVGRATDGLEGWLTCRALRVADRVVAAVRAEADSYARAGVPAERVEVIPPGVLPTPLPPDPVAFRTALDIPANGRLVIAAGRFDAAGGMRSAVWAFDVVRYVVPDLYLVLVGDGPERGAVERFAHGVAFDDYRVRFAGPRADLPAHFALAEVAWVAYDHGGVTAALEAMAVGRPVVAFGTPELAEVVEDGVTGRLVPPTDRVGLAAVTNELLDDPGLARRLAVAAQARARERFGVAEMAERYASLYDRLVRG